MKADNFLTLLIIFLATFYMEIKKVNIKVEVARKLEIRVTYCSKFIAVVFNKFLLESGK